MKFKEIGEKCVETLWKFKETYSNLLSSCEISKYFGVRKFSEIKCRFTFIINHGSCGSGIIPIILFE